MAKQFDTGTFERWSRRQEKDRARSQAARDQAKATGRPNPSAVDRAIVEAMQAEWAAHVAEQVAAGRDSKEASRDPIRPAAVFKRAVEILTTRKRADRKLAGDMVAARLNPHPPASLIVPKSANPLKARMTSYS